MDKNTDQIAAEAAEALRNRLARKSIYLPIDETKAFEQDFKAAIDSYVTQPKEIPLTDGKFATVDHQDFISLAGLTWHCTSHGRAATGKTNYMHKVIAAQMGIVGEVDHIDGNPLNNRRSNLRGCTRTQNQANAPKSRGSTSRYKGVHWSESHGGWVAQIKHNEKVTYLGKFDEETDAAITYDMAAKKEFGEYANLNFPIIQTLIEKAYQAGVDGMADWNKANTPRAARASEVETCWCGQEIAKHDMSHDPKAMPAHASEQGARELLYRIGRRMMESQATNEPLNLDLLRSEIDEYLYGTKEPKRFA